MTTLESLAESPIDVLICGGGLAGLTLARQLRRAHPERSIVIVEKTARPLPIACHKVGESSVELGSQYLERLGLKEYLLEHHIIKFGLRFFPGGGELPLHERAEIGPGHEPIVHSYQLDRGRFESDLRDMNEADGITLIEGASVRDVTLSDSDGVHSVVVQQGDAKRTLECRWFVDATGRNALLRRRLKLTRGTRHDASAGWFRIEGRFDITDMVADDVSAWHDVPFAKDRWRSTNHFMGEGYWAWVIPLSSGKTSIGLVVHEDTHSFDDVRTEERLRAFLAKHEPALAEALKSQPALDFLAIKNYSHNVGRAWSPQRWAIVGEAGAFVDPFYSPGTDFIAIANSFTDELIKRDFAGEDIQKKVQTLAIHYRALVLGNVDVYRTSSPTYGHARAMMAKIYWDNFAYWSFPCQYFLREIYREDGRSHTRFTEVGQRFVQLSNYVQSLLRAWAELAPETPTAGFAAMPSFPSKLIDAHLALTNDMTPDETFEYMSAQAAEGEHIVGELLTRIVFELDDGSSAELMKRAGVAKWDVPVSAERIEAEPQVGLARRRALSPLARDVERALGRPRAAVGPEVVHERLSSLVTTPESA